jgi:hypothetical protein
MACKKCGKMKCSCGGMVKKPVKKAMGGMVTNRLGTPRDTGPTNMGSKPEVKRQRPEFKQAMKTWRQSRPERPAGTRGMDWRNSAAYTNWQKSRPQRPERPMPPTPERPTIPPNRPAGGGWRMFRKG